MRNQLNISSGLQPSKSLWVRARLKLTSGLPYTPINGYFGVIQFDPSNLPAYTNQALNAQALFGKVNSARLPGYQSLDLSASYDLNLSWTRCNIQGTLINVLDRKKCFLYKQCYRKCRLSIADNFQPLSGMEFLNLQADRNYGI